MTDLEGFFPALRSVSVVPAGLTKFRDNLFPLEMFTPDECADVIDMVGKFGDNCLEKHGSRLFFCSDEFYIKSGRKLPDDPFYEEYSQIENGVGMLTSFEADIKREIEYIDEYLPEFKSPRNVSVITGTAAYQNIKDMCSLIESVVNGLHVNVYSIKNNFFGDNITVAGLLTATDIIDQLKGKDLGDELLFPACALRADGDIFLDDKTPQDISIELNIKATPTEDAGDLFIKKVLGI
jgi:NifB/MoaA-like Fe-S oxidoreductase